MQTKLTAKLNCDLGEGFDEVDRLVMPFIDQANIACGGHAGDSESMRRTAAIAEKRGVSIGAHPSYPDKANFGRVSIAYEAEALLLSLTKQVESLHTICGELGTQVEYIKAHGALYNDSMRDMALFEILLKLAKGFQCDLMVQALPEQTEHENRAKRVGVKLIKEGFADRAYTDSGRLAPRTTEGAVYENVEQVLAQATKLAKKTPILSQSGKALAIQVDSICVHGDNDTALDSLRAIYDTLRSPLYNSSTKTPAR